MMYCFAEPFLDRAPGNSAVFLHFAPPLDKKDRAILTQMLEEVVTNGVRFLDRTFKNWWERINLATLDIESARHCILGQLTGDYAHAVLWLGISWRGGEYGFASHEPILSWLAGIYGGAHLQCYALYYHILTELWKARIQLLRKERTGSEWKELIPEQEPTLDRLYRPAGSAWGESNESVTWSTPIGTTLAVVP
jgi:hypothetical protein